MNQDRPLTLTPKKQSHELTKGNCFEKPHKISEIHVDFQVLLVSFFISNKVSERKACQLILRMFVKGNGKFSIP